MHAVNIERFVLNLCSKTPNAMLQYALASLVFDFCMGLAPLRTLIHHCWLPIPICQPRQHFSEKYGVWSERGKDEKTACWEILFMVEFLGKIVLREQEWTDIEICSFHYLLKEGEREGWEADWWHVIALSFVSSFFKFSWAGNKRFGLIFLL